MGARNGLGDGLPKAAFGSPPTHALPRAAPVMPAIACDALQKAMLSCERKVSPQDRVQSLHPATSRVCSFLFPVPMCIACLRSLGLTGFSGGCLLWIPVLSYGSRLTAPFRLVGDFIPVCPLAFGAFRVRRFLPIPFPLFPFCLWWFVGVTGTRLRLNSHLKLLIVLAGQCGAADVSQPCSQWEYCSSHW